LYQGDGKLIEYLGIKTVYSDPLYHILPKNGWDKAWLYVKRLATVPGPADTRQRLAAGIIIPLCTWASPWFTDPPDFSFALRKSILRTKCSWWCHSRFYADRIYLHPVFITAIHGLCDIARHIGSVSNHLFHAMDVHAGRLRFEAKIVADAVWVKPLPHCDRRVVQFLAELDPLDLNIDRFFNVASSATKHALRLSARCLVMCKAATSGRYDIDGINDIDMNLQSNRKWTEYRKALSRDDANRLSFIRGGAIRTPTRRHFGRFDKTPLCCSICDAINPSARHFFEHCPGKDGVLDKSRREILAQYNISSDWWLSRPSVTSKSAWITLDADPSLARRVQLQLAVASFIIFTTKFMSCEDYYTDSTDGCALTAEAVIGS